MHAIDIGGDRYIKAADAADLTGYAPDYIGQLSRSGKVAAERVGRVWYVSERDILEHKKGNGSRSNKRKTQESLKKEIQDMGQIHHVMFDPAHGEVPEYRRRLLSEEVKYEKDTHPLTPSPVKAEEVAEEEVPTPVAPAEEEIVEPVEAPEAAAVVLDVADPAEESPVTEVSEIEEEISDKISDEIKNEVIEPAFVSRMHDGEPIEVKKYPKKHGKYRRAEAPSPISHIPLSETKSLVAHGNPSYSLAIMRVATPLILAAAVILSIGSVFSERIMVYEQGKNSIFRPSYETSYSVREVASVTEGVSGEVKGIFASLMK